MKLTIKIEISYLEYTNLEKYSHLIDVDVDFIFKNKFGWLNFTKSNKKDENYLKTFNVNIFREKFIFTKRPHLISKNLFIRNVNNIERLMFELLRYKNQDCIIYSNISEYPMSYLKKWSEITKVKIEEDSLFNLLDKTNVDVSEFALLKFKKVQWKKFVIYKSPYENNDKTEISQEEIIQSLYKNALLAMNNEDYKDHFITAPTGSGKSLIFQSLAYKLSKEHDLLTIIVSPLKALMQDQVEAFKKTYPKVATINSDTSYVDRVEAIEKIQSKEISVVYVSPETLMANSYERLFGDRKLGSLIIDEAHIATTWGRGFRPDYWYLDNWIKRVRKTNLFLIATFTATASYHQFLDYSMNNETKSNLLMNNPIEIIAPAYRDDVTYKIYPETKTMQKANFESFKIDKFVDFIKKHPNDKILIYFPFKKQTNSVSQMFEDMHIKNVVYNGEMSSSNKKDSFELYKKGKVKIMLATKAFGMGIDISDIKYVLHYAPTGTLNDYLQEVGRVARKEGMNGEGVSFPVQSEEKKMGTSDFTFIDQLYGMSSIKKHELIRIVQAIIAKYDKNKKTSMIIPFEDLSSNPSADNIEARLKICFIMLQRDLVNKFKFPPLLIRPSGIYTKVIAKKTKEGKSIYDVFAKKEVGFKDIYKIDLEKIWEKYFINISFPFFKLLYYSHKSHAENILKDTPLNVNLLDKITKLRMSYNPRQICEFNDIVKNKIKEAYNFGNKIIYELFSAQSKSKTLNKITIREVAKQLHLSYHLIIDFLNAIYSYYKQKFKNNVKSYAMLHMKIRHNVTQNWWEIKDKNLLSGIYFSLMQALESLPDNESDTIIIFPMSISRDSSYSQTLREIKLFEILEKFSIDSYSGMESKAFVKINSIKILKNLFKSKEYENDYIKTSQYRHQKSKKILKDFFFTSRTNWEIKDFIEKNFLLTDENI